MRIWTAKGYRDVGIRSRPARLTERSQRIIDESRTTQAAVAAAQRAAADAQPKAAPADGMAESTRIIGKVLVNGYVDGPTSEIDAGATYTFEAEVEGRWYRWTGQKPTIVGDRCRFWLRDGTPIAAPAEIC